ncbi:MAG: hypothetical protein JNL01_02820 [Bdellovibrionales bacterium]|nr:hypothetical protein [Bdellovibrionales bacterium]
MKTQVFRFGFLFSLGLVFVSCETEINKPTDNTQRDVIEAVMATIGGAMDDVAGSGGRKIANCSHGGGSCATTPAPNPSGTKTVTYACEDSASETKDRLKGTVQLSYTVTPTIGPAPTYTSTDGTPDCTLDVGETVTITGSTTQAGTVVGTLNRNTANLPLYDTAVPVSGGGVYVSRTGPNSFAMTILNKSIKQNLLNGSPNTDISVQSRDTAGNSYNLKDLTVIASNLGARGDRTVSGIVTGYHNTERYAATLNLSSVTWADTNCCWPTSGSGTITYSSGGVGSFSITGCGTVSIDGVSAEFRNCD